MQVDDLTAFKQNFDRDKRSPISGRRIEGGIYWKFKFKFKFFYEKTFMNKYSLIGLDYYYYYYLSPRIPLGTFSILHCTFSKKKNYREFYLHLASFFAITVNEWMQVCQNTGTIWI